MAVATNPIFVATEQDDEGLDMEQQEVGTGQGQRAGEDFASERGADFDAKRGAYEAAQLKLLELIDAPDTTIPVPEYRSQIKAAQKAVARAHKAMLVAWA